MSVCVWCVLCVFIVHVITLMEVRENKSGALPRVVLKNKPLHQQCDTRAHKLNELKT